MGEIWELVDENGNKIGVTIDRDKCEYIPKGMYHIAVDIWTKNKEDKILLTQRHPNKNWGLKWECSGGAIVVGEECIDGAIRELHEETGIEVSSNELIYLGMSRMKSCILHTYIVRLTENVELFLQPEEVVDYKWVDVDELESMKEDIVDSVWDRYLQFKDKIVKKE